MYKHSQTGRGVPGDAAGVTSAVGFDDAVAISRRGPGRYEAQPPASWDGPFGVNGGILAATLLRSAEAALDRPDLAPRVVSVHYVRSTASGVPVDVDVEPLRVGRRSAVVRAALHQGPQLTATATVTFSGEQRVATELDLGRPMPEVPPVEQVAELPAATFERPPAPPCLGRLRLWPCLGAPMFGGAPEAVTGGWVALRDDPAGMSLDAARLAALCDLWWPALFSASRTVVGVPTLALTVHLRSAHAVAAPVLARYETATLAEGHLDVGAALWSADGRLLAESHQLALLTGTWQGRPA